MATPARARAALAEAARLDRSEQAGYLRGIARTDATLFAGLLLALLPRARLSAESRASLLRLSGMSDVEDMWRMTTLESAVFVIAVAIMVTRALTS